MGSLLRDFFGAAPVFNDQDNSEERGATPGGDGSSLDEPEDTPGDEPEDTPEDEPEDVSYRDIIHKRSHSYLAHGSVNQAYSCIEGRMRRDRYLCSLQSTLCSLHRESHRGSWLQT